MQRWAIINKESEREIVNFGWFFDTTTQKDMEKRMKGHLWEDERIAVVEKVTNNLLKEVKKWIRC